MKWFFSLLVLAQSECFAADLQSLNAWFESDTNFAKAVQEVWGIRLHDVDEIRCFDQDFFKALKKSGLLTVDLFLRELASANIELASQELNQLTALDTFDVFALYRAHVRTLEQYLKTNESTIAYCLRLTPGQAKAVSFERRLLRFHVATGIERPSFTPIDQRILRAASPTGYTSLIRGSLMSWGFVVPSLSVLACLSESELQKLPSLGKIRIGEFSQAVKEYRLDCGESELAEFHALSGVDRMILQMAGVRAKDVYLERVSDEALMNLLLVSEERWGEIQAEREQAQLHESCRLHMM